MSEPTWYAAHTAPRKEALVWRELQRKGFATLWLHYVRRIKLARTTRVALCPLYPRYVFAANLNGTGPHEIARTMGVSKLVAFGNEPVEIPASVINDLRSRGNVAGLVKLEDRHLPGYREPWGKGQKVRISVGQHAGLQGIVTLDSGVSVGVEVEFLGRLVEVSVPPWALGLTSPERGDR